MISIKFKKAEKDVVLPSYAHDGDSGMDIRSVEGGTVKAGSVASFRTGLIPVLPWMVELQVRPRSGLSRKFGVFAIPGTVDSGYRGEISVVLANVSDKDFEVKPGDRIAQIVPQHLFVYSVEETDCVGGDTERGANGFGSTGVE